MDFGVDNNMGKRASNRIDEKSEEDADDQLIDSRDSKKKLKVSNGNGSGENIGVAHHDNAQGTQQSEERFNASQELLMGKYNKEDGAEEELGPEDKTCKGRAIRLYKWGRRNPLKALIIAMCLIIFSLIISIPIKDWQIENYPAEVEVQRAVTEAMKLKSADMERWKARNKTLYENISKNADEMLLEVLNVSTGVDGMINIFDTKVDFERYHDSY